MKGFTLIVKLHPQRPRAILRDIWNITQSVNRFALAFIGLPIVIYCQNVDSHTVLELLWWKFVKFVFDFDFCYIPLCLWFLFSGLLNGTSIFVLQMEGQQLRLIMIQRKVSCALALEFLLILSSLHCSSLPQTTRSKVWSLIKFM